MKLLLCCRCGDVFALRQQVRSCECGSTEGRYVDEVNAEYSGKHAVMLGFDNFSLVQTIKKQALYGNRADGFGRRFEAFIIPTNAQTIFNKENENND